MEPRDDYGPSTYLSSARADISERAEVFFFMSIGQGRDAAWAALERELRGFILTFDRLDLPEWLWSPETVRLVRVLRPKLAALAQLAEEGAVWGAAADEWSRPSEGLGARPAQEEGGRSDAAPLWLVALRLNLRNPSP